MSQQLISEITNEYMRKSLPDFRPGDTVKVHVKIVEGNRERIQVFEGLVIKRRGGGISETFTVRKNSYGIGVERTFPVHSPRIAEIEVVRQGKSVGRSLTTSVSYPPRPPELKKEDNERQRDPLWIRCLFHYFVAK